MSAFETAFAIVVGLEGGFDQTRTDPGNWTGGIVGVGQLNGTRFGVSAAAYPSLDIANLSLDQAHTIYRRDYWDRIAADDLPPPLALLVFDAAVNNGVGRAAWWLQEAAGTALDGDIGPETLAAVTSASTREGGAAVCAEFMAQRLAFMASLSTWSAFGLGWSRRLSLLPFQAMTMSGSTK
jgi:lysozyme family protein